MEHSDSDGKQGTEIDDVPDDITKEKYDQLFIYPIMKSF